MPSDLSNAAKMEPVVNGRRCSMNVIRSFLGGLILAAILLSLGSCGESPNGPGSGPKWRTFTTGNSGLLDNSVHAILAAGDGYVWIGTSGGASGFYKGSWTGIVDALAFPIYSSGDTTISHEVTALAEGRDGSLWFGLHGGGVRRYQRNSSSQREWISYHEPDVPYEFITSISANRLHEPGVVWVGTLFGVSEFTPSVVDTEFGAGVWTPFPDLISHFDSRNIYAISTDLYNGVAVFGTFSDLIMFDGARSLWSTVQPKLAGPVVALAYDKDANIWMGQWAGVSMHNLSNSNADAGFTSATTGGKLPFGPVNAVTTDLGSVRWFGTDAGLACKNDAVWSLFTRSNTPQLASDTITALAYDYAGNLWIGTPRGVTVYNEQGVEF